MRPLSKKQLDHLRLVFGLLIGATLLCFPAGIPVISPRMAFHALIAGAIALGAAHGLLKLGHLPAFLRPGLWLSLAFSVPLILLCLPDQLIVIWLLIPFAFILLSQRNRFQGLPTPLFILSVLLCLCFGAAVYLHFLTQNPHHGLPRFPNHIWLWLSIFAVIPLGFATRQRLRPLAKGIAKIELWIVFVLLGFYPIFWSTATSAKLPAEPALAFHQLEPLPRFYLIPSFGTAPLMPSELRNHPLQAEIVFTLNEMQWRLSEAYLRNTFNPDSSISPGEMLRAMKLYGFLLEDRHGTFLPEEAFTKTPPAEMEERFLEIFRNTMEQIVLGPESLARLLSIPAAEAKDIFYQMQHLNWVARIPGEPERYRLTPQARHPFANGLYPRQLLLIGTTEQAADLEMDQLAYGDPWQWPLPQIRRELQKLVDLGAGETRTTWKWQHQHPFILDAPLWRRTALLTLGFISALLAGRCLPVKMGTAFFVLICVAGGGFIWQWPYFPMVQPAIRLALGIWLLRNLIQMRDSDFSRISLYASGIFVPSVLMTSLPIQTALVHQTFWALLWFLPSMILLTLATRPLKISS